MNTRRCTSDTDTVLCPLSPGRQARQGRCLCQQAGREELREAKSSPEVTQQVVQGGGLLTQVCDWLALAPGGHPTRVRSPQWALLTTEGDRGPGPAHLMAVLSLCALSCQGQQCPTWTSHRSLRAQGQGSCPQSHVSSDPTTGLHSTKSQVLPTPVPSQRQQVPRDGQRRRRSRHLSNSQQPGQ